jgi:hypothetical protein
LALNLILASLLSIAGAAYSQQPENGNTGAVNRIDLFEPVFEIMTLPRGPDSPGCRGCHIGPDAFLPWGDSTVDTAQETLDQLEQERPDLLDGGRYGTLGYFLHSGIMPLNPGTPWCEVQLGLLDDWLITYE